MTAISNSLCSCVICKLYDWNCQDCPKTFKTLKGILIHVSKIHRRKKDK